MASKWTVSEMARELGVSRQRVHKLLDAYGIKAEQAGAGRLKLVSESQFQRLQKLRQEKAKKSPSRS